MAFPAFSYVLLLALLSLLPPPCQGCYTAVGYGNGRRLYSKCASLSSQGASLAYTYSRATRRLDIAFSSTAVSPGGWVGWGINPTGWGMVGSSVLVAFQAVNGSNVLPYKLTAAAEAGDRVICSPVDMAILSKSVQISGVHMTIFATIQLRPGQTSLNMVWNRGSSVRNFSPQPHSLLPANLGSFTTIDVAI